MVGDVTRILIWLKSYLRQIDIMKIPNVEKRHLSLNALFMSNVNMIGLW